MFEIVKKIQSLNFEHKNMWVNEAYFGLEHIGEYIEELHDKSSILEVGCGSGLLLSMLSEKYPNLRIDGIEPFGDGFFGLIEINSFIKSQGIKIETTTYENFEAKKKYDLIFCINVFEHLEDWKNFLEKVNLWLNEDGKCILLCPNYAIPYESHFKIPIIFSKKVTYMIFKNYIKKYEKENNCIGLWKSLNFVTKKKVQNFLNNNKLLMFNDINTISKDLVLRSFNDSEFKKRQKLMSFVGRIIVSLRLIKFFDLFPNQAPYMKLLLKKKI
tara:strand:- start:2252 stop:3064 length:813 start_codon:yes stop_codon:yes gene_type:complete